MKCICPCCLAEHIETQEEAIDFLCATCGHRWRTGNLPLNHYAACTGRNSGMPDIDNKHADRMADIDPLLRQDMRILEIGCAEGKFGNLVKKQLPVYYAGLEPSPDIEQAKAILDDVFQQPASAVNCPPFDLLLSFHVLEHIADIASEIACWKRLLTPSAHLVLEVPHRSGHPWLDNDRHPEHLHQFTQASLLLLLANAGLQAVKLSTGHFESPLYRDSLRVIARAIPQQHELARQRLARIHELLPAPFVILGLGGDFRNYVEPLLPQLNVTALCDNDPARNGERIGQYTVTSPYDPVSWQGQAVLVASVRHGQAIRQQLRALGVPDTMIIGIEHIYA